jgi:opacity protein-like surface antigen
MKKNFSSALGVLAFAGAALLVLPQARAAGDDAYVGAGGGVTFLALNANSNTYPSASDAAFWGLVGYQFTSNIGAELQAVSLGKFSYRTGSSTYDVRNSAVTVSVLGHLPLSNYFGFYGKVGGALARADLSPATPAGLSSHTKGGLVAGVGGEFFISPHSTIRVGYDYYQIDASVVSTGLNTFGVSALFKF